MCPACGYNLTGVCTVEKPTGVCPECGGAYSAQTVYRRDRGGWRTFLIILLIVEVIVLPVVVIFGSIAWLGSIAGGNPATLFIVPAIVALPIGLLLAGQYRVLSQLGVPRPLRPSPWPTLLLTTALFTIVTYTLGMVYFCGGCLVILSQLNL